MIWSGMLGAIVPIPTLPVAGNVFDWAQLTAGLIDKDRTKLIKTDRMHPRFNDLGIIATPFSLCFSPAFMFAAFIG